MARKLFIQTHGCQMNEYDSTRMVDLLESTHNLEPTDNPEDADVLLLNTCSIREKRRRRCSTSWAAGSASRSATRS